MNTEALAMISSFDYKDVKIPNDAETYMNLGYMEKFLIILKLSAQEYIGGSRAVDILKTLDKPLIKITYVLMDVNGNIIGEYDNEWELKKINNISENEFKYLKSYVRNNNIKNPKYDIYYKYRLKTNTYKLNGNNYILT